MRYAAGACENRPAVVVPIDHEARVAQGAGQGGDGQRGDGGRVLHEKPSGRRSAVRQDPEHAGDLPDHFEGPGDEEGHGFERSGRSW